MSQNASHVECICVKRSSKYVCLLVRPPLFVLLGVQPCVLSGYSEQQTNGGEGQQGSEPKLVMHIILSEDHPAFG